MEAVSKMQPEVIISARVIRADGTIEDLGVISRSKVSWFKRLKRYTKNLKGAK